MGVALCLKWLNRTTFCFQQDTVLSQEPLHLALHSHSSNSFRTTLHPPPRLQALVLPRLLAFREGSSSPIHPRELNSIHREPSLLKTIPPKPPSLPTTASHRAPSLARGINPAQGSHHLQVTLALLLLELLIPMLATVPLMGRAILNQVLDTGKEK